MRGILKFSPFIARNKPLQLCFRFCEAQRFARNILIKPSQICEPPSLGNVHNLTEGSVPFVFRWCLAPSPNNQQIQKELNLSSSFLEKVDRKCDGLKCSERTFVLLEI